MPGPLQPCGQSNHSSAWGLYKRHCIVARSHSLYTSQNHCTPNLTTWMRSVTDNWKSSHGKWKTKRICQVKFSCVTLQPKLELLRGPPMHCGSSPCDPQSFRLLLLAVSAGGDPLSPDGRGTCLWNAEVALQGRNVTWFVALHWYMPKCTSMRVFNSQVWNLPERLLPLCWFQEPGTRCSCKTLLKWFGFACLLEHFASWWKARFFYENVPETSLKTYLSSFWYVRKIYQPVKEYRCFGGKRGPPKEIPHYLKGGGVVKRDMPPATEHTQNIIYRGPPRPSHQCSFIPQ